MVEVEVSKAQMLERAVILAAPEYQELTKNLSGYQEIYRHRILDDVTDAYLLCDLMQIRSVGEVQQMKRKLEAYLKFLFNGVFERRLIVEQVCPACFMRSLVDTAKRNGDEIKKSCGECGFELTDDFTEETFSSAIEDHEITFKPSSAISYSGGLGCTFSPNSDREHKNHLWSIVNGDNVLFSEFQKSHPNIAAEFKAPVGEADCFELVWAGDLGKVFCHSGPFVRMISIDDYFNAVASLFHQFDAPLRFQKMSLAIDPKNELRRAKEYGLKLCEKYGFNNKDRDQAIYNTVGIEIDRLKPIVDMRKHHVSLSCFTETVFYIVVCRFDKKNLATKIKGDLDIDMSLVNFVNDVLDALDRDGKSPNYSTVFLNALESAAASRAKQA